jgi:hypothetical protein
MVERQGPLRRQVGGGAALLQVSPGSGVFA